MAVRVFINGIGIISTDPMDPVYWQTVDIVRPAARLVDAMAIRSSMPPPVNRNLPHWSATRIPPSDHDAMIGTTLREVAYGWPLLTAASIYGGDRPYEILQAMTILETELWWSPANGFTADAAVARANPGWKQIDAASTILTMTSSEAVRWGVAEGEVSDVPSLLALLGVEAGPGGPGGPGAPRILDFGDRVDRYNAQIAHRLDSLREQFRNYLVALGDLVAAMNGLADAYSRGDRQGATRAKTEVSRQVTRLRVAGGGIRKADRSLLARKIDVPDDVLAQLDTDAELLGRLSRLVSTDTYEGYAEAAKRVNTVIEQWRELLSSHDR